MFFPCQNEFEDQMSITSTFAIHLKVMNGNMQVLMSKLLFQLPPGAGKSKCNIAEDDVSTSKKWTLRFWLFSFVICRS